MDYSPFEGREITGRPMTVLSRGRIVVRDGEPVATRGGGRFVKRGVPDLTGLGSPRPPERDPATAFGADVGP
jgi:dihydropyrimidinase